MVKKLTITWECEGHLEEVEIRLFTKAIRKIFECHKCPECKLTIEKSPANALSGSPTAEASDSEAGKVVEQSHEDGVKKLSGEPRCHCSNTAKNEAIAELSGWRYNEHTKEWTCTDCAVEGFIEAMEET